MATCASGMPSYEELANAYLNLQHHYNIVSNERDNLAYAFKEGLLDHNPAQQYDLQAAQQYVAATEQARDAAIAQKNEMWAKLVTLEQQASQEISDLKQTVEKQASQLSKATMLREQIRNGTRKLRQYSVDKSTLNREVEKLTEQRDEAYQMIQHLLGDVQGLDSRAAPLYCSHLTHQLQDAQSKNKQLCLVIEELRGGNLRLVQQMNSLQDAATRSRRRISKLHSSQRHQLQKQQQPESKARAGLQAKFKAAVMEDARRYLEAKEELVEKKYREEYGKTPAQTEKEMCDQFIAPTGGHQPEKKHLPPVTTVLKTAEAAEAIYPREKERSAFEKAEKNTPTVAQAGHQHIRDPASRALRNNILENQLATLRGLCKEKRLRERAAKMKELKEKSKVWE